MPRPIVPPQLLRRYLVGFDASRVAHRFTDVAVIGTGVAGLSAALAAADRGAEVLLISKAPLEETATRYAQGGVAAVVDPAATDDSLERHIADTTTVGEGLSDEDVVRIAVSEGVDRVNALTEMGTAWDRSPDGALHFTLEGGHSRPRILHRGDTTGFELERVLAAAAIEHPRVTILVNTFALDLVTTDETCRGALVERPHGEREAVWAKRTILATGGLGRLFRETTNPRVATGDGVAMAFRAGATVRDLEFVQFHPTTLYIAGADRFLITEAVRGEGAILVDGDGRRFMRDFHPQADLAPRDVVSRAIVKVMRETGANRVFLDLSPISPEHVRHRFPKIREKLLGFGIDIASDPIPVRPSAHYSIGGVQTDDAGHSSLRGLFAAGEVASTGLHGANRLASNSLLEGLVFGHRAGLAAASEAERESRFGPSSVADEPLQGAPEPSSLDLEDLTSSLRSLLWQKVGLERDEEGLSSALGQIETWIQYVLETAFLDSKGWGLQNMLLVAYLLTLGALRREESRGVHFRTDFPARDDERWRRHVALDARSIDGLSTG